MKTVAAIFLLTLCLLARATWVPPRGGRIVVGYSAYPTNLLYYVGNDDYSNALSDLVFDTLIEQDPRSGKLVPRLASHWQWSKDHSTLTFFLNPKARFSDGVPVTSHDVKFTWEKLRDPAQRAATYQALLENFDRCTTPNLSTVAFHSRRPSFSDLVTLGELYVLPEHAFKNKNLSTDFNRTFLGSGPYRIEHVEPGERITLKRNPQYWGWNLSQNGARYNFDEMVFKVIPDYNAQFEALVHGDIDYYYFLSGKLWATHKSSEKFKDGSLYALELSTLSPPNLVGIAWNVRRPLFQDRNVRLALGYLMNRKLWEKALFQGAYESSTGAFALSSPFHAPDLKPIPYDPQKALALLKKAGWNQMDKSGHLRRGSEPFIFSIVSPTPSALSVLSLYQQDLKKVGIEMKIQIEDWATWFAHLNERQFDAAQISYSRDPIPNHLARSWGSEASDRNGTDNVSGIKDSLLDKLAARIDATYVESDRVKLLQEFDRRVSDLAPMGFGWEPTRLRIATSHHIGSAKNNLPAYATWINVFQYQWDRNSEKHPPTVFEAGERE